MIVTPAWIQSLKDDKGLTKGQIYLLNRWLGDKWEGELDDFVAKTIESCKGYRGIPPRVLHLKGWLHHVV